MKLDTFYITLMDHFFVRVRKINSAYVIGYFVRITWLNIGKEIRTVPGPLNCKHSVNVTYNYYCHRSYSVMSRLQGNTQT